MSPKLGHLMGLSCPMLALHWFWFGTSAGCESATFQEKVKQGSCAGAPSSKNQFSFYFRTTLQNSNESQTWPPDGSELPHAGTALVLVWDLCLGLVPTLGADPARVLRHFERRGLFVVRFFNATKHGKSQKRPAGRQFPLDSAKERGKACLPRACNLNRHAGV